ncbi:cysteine desulfurase family protein [Microbacterium azadirachtae]|uniref:cysteine desulfurase family protein n=1 Tax=Microbacterium azadirachtae TaxID=582680 RepID=UPI000880FA77|nr:cysteine desulfurase family protein [Microbacterium azadirachtae]SDM28303.1 cysteine desulfurase [Microbacterium azadirachtae]SEG48680.1 cysteine desulfurase [Microbacterium azadirachtae]SEG51284.1 cysteine desulfurase [Microbacterium azadirachtae]
MSTSLYLDHAATSPVRGEVLEAMAPFLTRDFGNPSSHHTVGESAAAALEDARARVARVLGMRTGDVVFTAGGTEANNLAVKGIVLAAHAGGSPTGARTDGSDEPTHVITTPIEHESILESVRYLERFHGVVSTLVAVDDAGRVDPAEVAAAIRPGTALIAVGHANNEIGTIQDVAAIVAAAAQGRIPVHVDAVQSAGWLPLDGLGADAIAIAGHKLGAPKGIGALAVRGRVPLEPLVHGGGQERGRRSGTENVAGAVALATALDLAEAERAEAASRVGAQSARFIAGVLDAVPSARLTGDPVRRLPATASFVFPEVSGEAVLLELERRGVVSSSGSACAAGSDEPSHVLLACGLAPAVAQTSVRFTFGRTGLAGDGPERLAALVADAVAAVRA